MQQKKDEIREAILVHSKAEFIEKGFQKTTMRSIATRSSVTLSNIYTYFKNKEELFTVILKPLINKIERGKRAMESHIQHGADDTVAEHFDMQNIILDFLEENRSDLQLLINRSRGSVLESFVSDFKLWYIGINKNSMIQEAQENGFKDLNISDFVMDFISSIYVDILVKAITLEVDRAEMVKISLDIIAYGHSGWRGLLKWASTR